MLRASIITETNVWVRCFDTQLRGEIAPLPALIEELDAGPYSPKRYFSGRGGDDLHASLGQALNDIPVLPNGRPIDRLIVAFDGYDGTSIVPTQGDRRIPITYVVAHQEGHDVPTRFKHAREKMPLAHLVDETTLIRHLERYALESVVPAMHEATLVTSRPLRARL